MRVEGILKKSFTWHCGTNGTNHFQAGVSVFGYVFEEGGLREAEPPTIRTREALWLLRCNVFTSIVEFIVGARENALHRMLGRVSRRGRTLVVAIRT